jgi:hypothetical protein
MGQGPAILEVVLRFGITVHGPFVAEVTSPAAVGGTKWHSLYTNRRGSIPHLAVPNRAPDNGVPTWDRPVSGPEVS